MLNRVYLNLNSRFNTVAHFQKIINTWHRGIYLEFKTLAGSSDHFWIEYNIQHSFG